MKEAVNMKNVVEIKDAGEKPKFIVSVKKALSQYTIVKNAADIVSYSSKTNQAVAKILEEKTDCFFSIHFINELKHIKDKTRVMFLLQACTPDEIIGLIELGIRFFILDNEADLDIFLKTLKENNQKEKINLLLRIKLMENTIKTERYFIFGISSEIVNRRLREIRENKELKEKIGLLGVHFHRKTQNMSEWNLKYELSQILDQKTMELIDLVNIGGGLPSEYANTNADVVQGIFKKISELREWLNEKNIKLIIEPGRFIAAPAGKLMTRIIGIHENNIIVNASVYNTDMDALIVPVKLLVGGELQKIDGKIRYDKSDEEKSGETKSEDEKTTDEKLEEVRPWVIKGITPCSMDIFRYRVYLKNPKIGDKIIFLNAGAYNFTTDFCDLDRVETEIVE